MKRIDDFMMQHVGGENIIVPLGSQVVELKGLVILNNTGEYIWTLLEDDKSIDELTDAVAEKFEVDLSRARTDVCVFTDQLIELGMIE